MKNDYTHLRPGLFRKASLIVVLAVSVVLAGCKNAVTYPAPPRLESAPVLPKTESSLLVPISISLDEIQRGMERQAPTRLWSIDEQRPNCIPAQRIKLFKRRLRITPDLGCRIVGEITRGALTLTGKGTRITIRMPIRAVVAARDIGGILKGKTATASAMVRADVRFTLNPDWSLRGNVTISYDWTDPPGINFLGMRIRFANRADRELVSVISGLERNLQAQIAGVRFKPIVEGIWRKGFTVIELNHDRPPAWMRVTPRRLALAGYRVDGPMLRFDVAATARTETFVGSRPSSPPAEALPRAGGGGRSPGLRFFVPIMADYAVLEPVVLRSLQRLASRGIPVGNIGNVDAHFEKVAIYATEGNRLAVGIDVEAEIIGRRTGNRYTRTRGRIWLTGLPVHEANSQVIAIHDLRIFGNTDRNSAYLLLQLMGSDRVRHDVARSLTQDFSADYQRVLSSAGKAIADRQEGEFRISARIDRIEHGLIQATRDGLFLPAELRGSGSVQWTPVSRRR